MYPIEFSTINEGCGYLKLLNDKHIMYNHCYANSLSKYVVNYMRAALSQFRKHKMLHDIILNFSTFIAYIISE